MTRKKKKKTPQSHESRENDTESTKRRLRLPVPTELEDLLFSVCRMFFDRKRRENTRQIAESATAELKRRGKDLVVTRQQIYPMIEEAIRLGYVRFCPPRNLALAQRIADLLKIQLADVVVVNARGPESVEPLAAAAADLTLKLIESVAQFKREAEGRRKPVPVHLGLGCGHTTMLVAKQLGQRLRSDFEIEGVSKLVLHAMNCGFSPAEPQYSAVSYFSFFSDLVVPIEYVGLFAQAVVSAGEFYALQEQAGVSDSFGCRREIDIVLTSLGSPQDKHCLLNRFEDHYVKVDSNRGVSSPRLRRVGDVQFRPYTATGPIRESPREPRAVTLFELEDFAHLARTPGKHVILVSGLTKSNTTRTDALLPLLTVPELRVWSHLCFDLQTAKEVIESLAPKS